MSLKNPGTEEATAYVESYQSFASNLRAWLIAYGIGAPVLFASQSAFSEMLKNKGAVTPVIYAFLIGMSIQIFAAFLYKASMWYIMWGAMTPTFKTTCRYKFSDWVSEQLWLELLFDIASVSAFAWATVKVLLIYAS